MPKAPLATCAATGSLSTRGLSSGHPLVRWIEELTPHGADRRTSPPVDPEQLLLPAEVRGADPSSTGSETPAQAAGNIYTAHCRVANQQAQQTGPNPPRLYRTIRH